MRINCGIFIENKVSFTTYKFHKNLYLGCPLNTVYHFDKFDYDEILLVNKTNYVDSFDLLYLKLLSESSYKPKCYAGGVKSLSQAKSIIEIGFERISFRDLFFEDKDQYLKIIKVLGRQGVTLCLDIKMINGNYFIISNDRPIVSLDNFHLEEEFLPGELFINNVDLNGTLLGPDLSLINIIKDKKFKTNINYCGGIRNKSDVNLINQLGIDAVTIFTAVSTISNGSQKLINNSFFI
jgi:cyclase